MRRNRVVIASGSFQPREGGAERQLRLIAKQMVSDGIDVRVLTQALPGSPRLEAVDGIHVRRLGRAAVFRDRPRLAIALFSGEVLVRLLQYRPDAVISTQLGAASLAAMTWTVGTPGRAVVRLTGGGGPQHRSEPLARANSKLGRAISLLTSRNRISVVAPSRHLADDMEEAFPRSAPVQVIPNGQIRIEDAAESGAFGDVVAYARPGARAKQADLLGKLLESLPDLRRTVIGHATDLPFIPGVDLAGWVDDPEYVISGHRVAVLTSRSEGMPNFALQALANHVPVAAFENPGLLEVKQMSPDNVHLAPFGEIGVLRDRIESAISAGWVGGDAQVATIAKCARDWGAILFGEATTR